jgi:hypothetical protein
LEASGEKPEKFLSRHAAGDWGYNDYAAPNPPFETAYNGFSLFYSINYGPPLSSFTVTANPTAIAEDSGPIVSSGGAAFGTDLNASYSPYSTEIYASAYAFWDPDTHTYTYQLQSNESGDVDFSHAYEASIIVDGNDANGGSSNLSSGTVVYTTSTVVPEPATAALLSIGLAALLGKRARQKSRFLQ